MYKVAAVMFAPASLGSAAAGFDDRCAGSRGVRAVGGRLLAGALLMFALAVVIAAPSAEAGRAKGAPSGLRVLYASDWSGTMQIYAADPTGRSPVKQVTFARPEGPCDAAAGCGYTRPQPSPN
jgi:hypothetical protein